MLSERVAETSVQIARKLAERPVGLHRVTAVLAAVVAFGALCVRSGYSLASAEKPFWVTQEANLGVLPKVLSLALSVPAGWMILSLIHIFTRCDQAIVRQERRAAIGGRLARANVETVDRLPVLPLTGESG